MTKRGNQSPEAQYRVAIDALLFDLCVNLGFCGDTSLAEPFDRARTSWTADDFTVEVLRAEGLNPIIIEGIGPSRSEYFVWIPKFVERFGGSVSAADFE